MFLAIYIGQGDIMMLDDFFIHGLEAEVKAPNSTEGSLGPHAPE